MDEGLFNELLDAANEAVAHHRGQKANLRTTVLPEPPRPMSRAAVKRLRERARVSQSVFAHFLNVSPKLVQAWEGGTRTPDGPALVLLRLAERLPDVIFPVAQDEPVVPSRQPAGTGDSAHRRGTRSDASRSTSTAAAPRKQRAGGVERGRRTTARA